MNDERARERMRNLTVDMLHKIMMQAEMLEKGYRKQSEWISVDERLPEERERVLVVCEDGVVRMNMIKHGYFPEITNIECISVKTTHWMPLPEPPDTKGGV